MNARSLKRGVYGGLAGGVVFGMMMGMMGMLPMIGGMVGSSTVAAGFAVHLGISALIGAGFAVSLGNFVASTRQGLWAGLLYGGAWWVLGPLTLMPFMMGMGLGVNWTVTAAVSMMPSLVGHLIYGTILGVVYARLGQGRFATVAATAV